MTRKTPGVLSTRLLNRGDQVTINLSFKHSRVKIYLKEDRALRVETVINWPGDLSCKRGLEHLDELIERIAHPTTDAAGRRVPAMRFADPRVQALAGCLAVWDHAVSGITNNGHYARAGHLRPSCRRTAQDNTCLTVYRSKMWRPA